MSKNQSSGLNSGISFSSQHGADPSVGGARGDVGLFMKPSSLDIPPHTPAVLFPTPSVHPKENERVGLKREREKF